MQLGARWRAGEAPHRSVPAVLHAEIHEQELRRPTETDWTLTWLEGRPQCMLGSAVRVSLAPSGEVIATGHDETDAIDAIDAIDDQDDDWLR